MFNFNSDAVKGKWKEIKGDVRSLWGNLTEDDLEKTHGNMDSLAGVIQQKYGISREEVEKKLNSLADRYGLSGVSAQNKNSAGSSASSTQAEGRENTPQADQKNSSSSGSSLTH